MNTDETYPCAKLERVASIQMDSEVLYRSLPLKLRTALETAFNVTTAKELLSEIECSGPLRNFDKFNTIPIILVLLSFHNSAHVNGGGCKKIRTKFVYNRVETYTEKSDAELSSHRQQRRVKYYKKFITVPHVSLLKYFDRTADILRVAGEPTDQLFVIDLKNEYLINELYSNPKNDHTIAIKSVLDDAKTPQKLANPIKRKLYNLEGNVPTPKNLVHSTVKEVKKGPPKLQQVKRLVNKYNKKTGFKSCFSKVGAKNRLAIIAMPSSDENIKLGDEVNGDPNTEALYDLMVRALKLQIRSRMKIDSASEFIQRTYFLETINGEISQRPHVASAFNNSTNRNSECTESFWSADIPITPTGMELNIWPSNASLSNVCKPIRLKVNLGQFIVRSPSVVHGGSYPGQRVHMAIATNKSQKADIDNKSPSIVTENENKVDYTKFCLPREHDDWE